jgi:DNA-binding transcriptional LysR family regulator
MELRQIEAFVSVATLRSFQAAANRLHITQPAVSLRLSTLEEELGAKLLEREGGKIGLTAKGMQLLHLAELVLDTAGRIKTLAAGEPATHQRIRIGATGMLVNAWMHQLIAEMSESLPQLTADIIVGGSPELRTKLVAGELDLALMMGPTHFAGVRNLPLSTYGTHFVASRKLGLPKKMTLKELAQHRLITHARDSATYGSVEELFRNSGNWPVNLASSNSVEAIMRIVQAGLAVGAISDACLLGEPDPDEIVMIDCPDRLPAHEYFASYHMDSVGRVGMMVAEIAQRVSEANLPPALK